MGTAVSLIFVSLVQGAWQVEETPLVPTGWHATQVLPFNDDVACVAATRFERDRSHPREKSDSGVSGSSLFVVRAGQAPELVRAFPSEITLGSGSGTGFTLNFENQVFRLRLAPAPTLISLGTFDPAPIGVSCDLEVTDCVLVFGTEAPLRWRNGVLSPLPNLPDAGSEEARSLLPSGVAMHPDGGVASLAVSLSTAVMALDTGRITLVHDVWSLKLPSLQAMERAITKEDARGRGWSSSCAAVPLGWQDGMPTIMVTEPGGGIGEPACEARPESFKLDLKTGRRYALPAYPWSVLDCPNGGWTSSVGTMVTDCEEDNGLPPSRSPNPRRRRSLPEAVALSPTEVFVMEPERNHPYRWYRRPPTASSKPLAFIVDGPSVLRFEPRGVTVEKVDWRFGTAVFEHAMSDDWHVIQPTGSSWAMVRISRAPE